MIERATIEELLLTSIREPVVCSMECTSCEVAQDMATLLRSTQFRKREPVLKINVVRQKSLVVASCNTRFAGRRRSTRLSEYIATFLEKNRDSFKRVEVRYSSDEMIDSIVVSLLESETLAA